MHSINYKWNNLLIILEIFFKSKKYREIREPKSVLAVSKMTAGESSEGAGRNLKWLCRSVSPPNVSANPRWIYRDGGNRLFLALFKGLEFLSGFFPPFPGKHLYIFTHIFTPRWLARLLLLFSSSRSSSCSAAASSPDSPVVRAANLLSALQPAATSTALD